MVVPVARTETLAAEIVVRPVEVILVTPAREATVAVPERAARVAAPTPAV